jgi:hypothetical protein
MAVVKKIRFSQTTGEEWPRPGMGVFHAMFFVALHSVGRFFSAEMPWLPGPRHPGQFEPLLVSFLGKQRAVTTSKHKMRAH